MGQPKESSAKKNVFVEKYDEIRSFDGNSAKYYFHEKSRFLHTFLKFYCESRKI
jgi:hypothetical protein